MFDLNLNPDDPETLLKHYLMLTLQAIKDTRGVMDYAQFCERTGFKPDAYSMSKFQKWQQFSEQLLEVFDVPTLIKLLLPEWSKYYV